MAFSMIGNSLLSVGMKKKMFTRKMTTRIAIVALSQKLP